MAKRPKINPQGKAKKAPARPGKTAGKTKTSVGNMGAYSPGERMDTRRDAAVTPGLQPGKKRKRYNPNKQQPKR